MTAKKKPATDEFTDPPLGKMKRGVWALSKIYPYPKNPRTHPPAQIALLAELMKKFGPDQDIVVDEDGVILKGHGRRLAAIAAGRVDYPVTQRLGLSETDKAAMRIQDNQVALLAGWDQELVRGEIAILKTDGFDVGLLGFGEQQLVQFLTTPGPPAEFQQFGADIPTEHECPSCGYRWSGKSAPAVVAAAPKAKKRAKKK